MSHKYWSREGLSQIPISRLICIGGFGRELAFDEGPDMMTADEFLLFQGFKPSWPSLLDIHIDRADLQQSGFQTARFARERY